MVKILNKLKIHLLLVAVLVIAGIPWAWTLAYTKNVLNITVRKRDTMKNIFLRNRLSMQDLTSLLSEVKSRKTLETIYPGQRIRIFLEHGKKVARISLQRKGKNPISIERLPLKKHTAYQPKMIKTGPYKKVQFNIRHSLYMDGKKNGLTPKDIHAIAEVMKEDSSINLSKLAALSKFTVILTQGEKPHVVAIDIEQGKQKWTATEFQDSNGVTQYYHEDGSTLSASFLRYPLKRFYISSHFSPNRKHPILGINRPHYGVDFAASYGTPIWATAPGVVQFLGYKGGFGKTLVIKHDKNYTTTYAHLSRFGKTLKVGDRVEAKQIIGFVGKSGTATGSHLHYEIRKNGVPFNPLKKFPEKSSCLTGKAYKYFEKFRKMLMLGN